MTDINEETTTPVATTPVAEADHTEPTEQIDGKVDENTEEEDEDETE